MRKDLVATVHSFPFHEISLGYRTVTLFAEEQLEQAQVGYSIDLKGQSLCGTEEGSWLAQWLVIGFEDETGDPIFVDVHDEQFPVYSAVHGQGDWRPFQIAVSLTKFVTALGYIKELSHGRENPVALEQNPIPSIKRKEVLDRISQDNQGIDIEFWETWLEDIVE
ncbi:hypothetical protein LJK88_28185 [Paenibacillus sp. P26]|nr:hypothetical protein LJK88_28185 [Paenibacillus sp. P26]UUZ94784.1 hypothetical protein LJK87_09810 [Paenibacillus sp. P25]